MPKCPGCSKDISALYMERRVKATYNMSYNVSIDEKANSLELTHMEERDETPDISDTLGEAYYCPECNEPICGDGEDAKTFLEGGKI